jgi:hypothetical protein
MSMSVKAKTNANKGGASKSRTVEDEGEDEDDDEEVVEGFGGSDDEDVDMGDAGAGNEGGDEELGTDEEIELAKGGGKSKKAGQSESRSVLIFYPSLARQANMRRGYYRIRFRLSVLRSG